MHTKCSPIAAEEGRVGGKIPSWLFTADGQQHVSEKIRDSDYFIGYIADSPATVLWIKWADVS